MTDGKRQISVESIAAELYECCRDRTTTPETVFSKLSTIFSIETIQHIKHDAVTIIGEYKKTGKNLESVANILYRMFQKTTLTQGGVGGWGNGIVL